MTKMELGNRIRELRTTKGLSQMELAMLCGLQGSYIGMLENGQRNPTFDVLNKIAAEGFGISMSEMLNDKAPAINDEPSMDKIRAYAIALTDKERIGMISLMKAFIDLKKY